MTEPADPATKDTYEGAIRSFTEAEIALREIVTGLQRFRAASDQVAEAGTSLADAQEAVERWAQVLETAVVALTAIAAKLASAAEVIADFDPPRFWEAFDRLEAAASSSATAIQQALVVGFDRVDAGQAVSTQALTTTIATAREATANDIRAAAAEVGSSVTSSGARLDTRIGAASEGLQEATRRSAESMSAKVGDAQRVVAQARMLSAVAVGLGLGAVALLILLLIR